jgi:DeoR family transcriptional regulator, fructose operon transcriptional repressor
VSSTQPNLASEERLQWLAARLAEAGSVSIADAAVELDVSEMTIRRDIVELEERGLARRVRGGALPLGPQTFAERSIARPRVKAQIAAKLAAFIPATGVIAFDASSTVMRAAASLAGARDLTVVTNGPDTFAALQGRPGVTPTLTGGRLDARTGSLVGPIACWSARQLTVSRFIASAAALDPTIGATELVLEEADVKRSIAEGADEVVLAVDSSKLGHRATVVGFGWDDIDVIVTELEPDDRRLAPYRGLARIV